MNEIVPDTAAPICGAGRGNWSWIIYCKNASS